MAGNHTVSTTDEGFDKEVLLSPIPVLVDFWAEWCGPCRALAPKLEEVALEFSGRIKVVKVNVDESPNITAKYGVRGIPALAMFKNGAPIDELVGNHPKEVIVEFVNNYLKKTTEG